MSSTLLQFSLRYFTQPFVRSLQSAALTRPVPSPQGRIKTPQAFLKVIGRSSETKLSIDSWEAFWRTSGHDLKKAGVAVKDRRYVEGWLLRHVRLSVARYILWCMEMFRQGTPLPKFVHEAKPAKKIRGRGPRVQHGKVIRSRRAR
ncbi:hypothetical protein F5I97DRAFT_1357195 [Phlebopus sp. FC_14]|nr:hypothetical protein F5I97DRAFT_1357195 [Phlebopus sp. FC_14]